jgi:hypothetical protein
MVEVCRLHILNNVYFFFKEENLLRNEQEDANESDGGGLSGTEDASILIQQIRRETTGIAKFPKKKKKGDTGSDTEIIRSRR